MTLSPARRTTIDLKGKVVPFRKWGAGTDFCVAESASGCESSAAAAARTDAIGPTAGRPGANCAGGVPNGIG